VKFNSIGIDTFESPKQIGEINMPIRKIAKYGWKRDLPDARDFKVCHISHFDAALLPAKVDLSATPYMPPVYDQGQLGSCTANAIAAAVQFDQRKQKPVWDFMPSRLFIYYNERVIEGTVSQDAGAEIRDGVKTVNSLGVCKETLWGYNINEFAVKPPAVAFNNALMHKSVRYQSVPQDLNTFQSVLAAGTPVVIGFTVYTEFESQQVADSGVLNMPGKSEQVLGGHAVLVVGYDNATQRFLIRNSWGTGWGLNGTGYFTMPYAYLMNPNLASDFWAINFMNP
jgi:C1A family cysteine protease